MKSEETTCNMTTVPLLLHIMFPYPFSWGSGGITPGKFLNSLMDVAEF